MEEKVPFAIKINRAILNHFKTYCDEHGIKYSFFVEAAIKGKLDEEEMKEDLLDFKKYRKDEEQAISFEEYLRERDA